ncbi:MAG TPA: hypothetical protein VGR57_16065 [Ktedonobacterales bacterium]|nr:hypothetical protein [Ktedonobacterales bacterium]
MNEQPPDGHDDRAPKAVTAQRALEAIIFMLASAVGIYGIGKGMEGFYLQGHQNNLLWLAVTAFAFFVLFAQMGRVHDTWPHRPGKGSAQAAAQIDAPDRPLDVEGK